MDVAGWSQAISSYGFPIVCCIVMFKYLEKEREAHREEINSVTQALNENSRIINDLKNVIEKLIEVNKNDSERI